MRLDDASLTDLGKKYLVRTRGIKVDVSERIVNLINGELHVYSYHGYQLLDQSTVTERLQAIALCGERDHICYFSCLVDEKGHIVPKSRWTSRQMKKFLRQQYANTGGMRPSLTKIKIDHSSF